MARSRKQIAQINVVPMIDVMLVLLVIFMVTAPFINPGLVELPSVGKTAKTPEQPLEVVIKESGEYLLRDRAGNSEERVVNKSALAAEIAALHGASPDQPVVIAADKNVRYEEESPGHPDRTARAPGAMNVAARGLVMTRRHSNLVAGMLALGMHGLFLLLLVFGVSWQTQHPAPVMVDIWQALPKPELAPAPAPRRAKVNPPKTRTPPPPDRRDADIALEKKKAEVERLKHLQAEQAVEEKAQAKAAQEKLLADQKKRALLRQMDEEDLKQRVAAETAANQARQAKFAEAQAKQAEAQVRQAAAKAAADAQQAAEVASTVGLHRDLISAKVRGNTRLPDNLTGNPEVRCLVRLLPTGEVLSVRVTKSSGNVAYDDAVVRAIEKSSPLPLPTDRQARAAFVPELSFIHRPKE